jgi:hypothetical protein
MADNRLVITVAPQKDICPHGRTYPKNAVIIERRRIVTPDVHVIFKKKELK